MDFMEIGEQTLDVIQGVRPLGVPGQQHALPRDILRLFERPLIRCCGLVHRHLDSTATSRQGNGSHSPARAARNVFRNTAGTASRATVALGRPPLTSAVRPSSGGFCLTSMASGIMTATDGA